MIKYLAFSSIGKHREFNGDRVFIDDTVISSGSIVGDREKEIRAGICDGVGSTRGSEFAAELVASSFNTCIISETSALSITKHLHEINRVVLLNQKTNPQFQNMATTLAGIMIYQNRYLIFNLGDTRVYFVNNGEIELKTRDHTVANSRKYLGYNYSDVQKDMLTGYIGGQGLACNPSISRGIIRDTTSMVFICSDGVYKYISEDELKEVLVSNMELEEKEEAILKKLLQNGSTDDTSFVIIEYIN